MKTMDNNDWGFAIGNLGDPLVDIKDYMIPPFSPSNIKRIKSINRNLRKRIRDGKKTS